MTNQLKKQDPAKKVRKAVDTADAIIASSGNLIRIGDVYYHESFHCDFWRVRGFKIADNYKLPTVEVELVGIDNDGNPVKDIHTVTHRELQGAREYILLDIPTGKTVKEVIAEAVEEGFQALKDPSLYLKMLESLEKSEDTGIVSVDQKSTLETTQALLEQQQRRVRLVQELMKSKVSALSGIANRLQTQLTKIKKIIGVIELYLGINEEILQIQEGEPAPATESIAIRQLVLYMDEETGIYEDGGIDCNNVEEFDEWLIEKGHLDHILPEKKGMVVLCPSRQDKYHSGNNIYDSRMKQENLMSYLLVRNGEKVYRIWTSLQMGERFFPTLVESEHIEILFEEASQKGYFDFDTEKAQDARFLYLRNTFLIQGLIDRTLIFEPLEKQIDFFSPLTYQENGPIRLIRDDELLLPSGRIHFWDWQLELNKILERGSRVYVAPFDWRVNTQEYKFVYSHRFNVYRNQYPSPPDPGLYIVEEISINKGGIEKEYPLRILYRESNPWGDASQRRISFHLSRKDRNILNYDRISLEDLDFYIHSRQERRNFLEILPVLVQLRKERLREIEDEKGFVALLSRQICAPEEKVWEAVEWWKYKNIWKRPVRKDDTLAWRMIRQRITGHR